MDVITTTPLVLSTINHPRRAVCFWNPTGLEPCLVYASRDNLNVFDFPSFHLRQVICFSNYVPPSRLPLPHGVEALCATTSKLVAASGSYVAVFVKSNFQSSALWNLHSSFTSCLARITSIILKGNLCLLIGEDGLSLYQVIEPNNNDEFSTIPRWIRKWATHTHRFTDADLLRSSDDGYHIASFEAGHPTLHFYTFQTSALHYETSQFSHRTLRFASPLCSISFDLGSSTVSEKSNGALYVSIHNAPSGIHTHIYDLETVTDDRLCSKIALQDASQPMPTMLFPSHRGIINRPCARSQRVIRTFFVDLDGIPLIRDCQQTGSGIAVLSILSTGHVHVSREPSTTQLPITCSRLHQLPQEMIEVLGNPHVLIYGAIRIAKEKTCASPWFIILARSASVAGQLYFHSVPLQSTACGFLYEYLIPDKSQLLDYQIPYGHSVTPSSGGAGDLFLTTSDEPTSGPTVRNLWQLRDKETRPRLECLSKFSPGASGLAIVIHDDTVTSSNNGFHTHQLAKAVTSYAQWWIQVADCGPQKITALRTQGLSPPKFPSTSISELALIGLQDDERLVSYIDACEPMGKETYTGHWYLKALTSFDRLLVWELPLVSFKTACAQQYQPIVALNLPNEIIKNGTRYTFSSAQRVPFHSLIAADDDGNIFETSHFNDYAVDRHDPACDSKRWSRIKLMSLAHLLTTSGKRCSVIHLETRSSLVALLYLISSPPSHDHLKLIVLDLQQLPYASGIVGVEEMSLQAEENPYTTTHLTWSPATSKDSLPSSFLLAVACAGVIKIFGCDVNGWWTSFADVRSPDGSAQIISWITLNDQRCLMYEVHGHGFLSRPMSQSSHSEMPIWHPIILAYHLDFGEFEYISETVGALAVALKGNSQPLSLLHSPAAACTQHLDLKNHKCREETSKITKSALSQENLDILVSYASESRVPLLHPDDQRNLVLLAKQLYTVQRSFNGIDTLGCRYLFSLIRHFLISDDSEPDLGFGATQDPAILLAYHSSSQVLLATQVLENVPKYDLLSTAPNKFILNWRTAREIGIFLWLKCRDTLLSILELVAQHELQSSGRAENGSTGDGQRDPAASSIFYMALRKKRLLLGLWRVAYGHPDRPLMLKFLANDFEEARWKTAAQKNAFALISRQRFNAVNVCIRQLSDWRLAIAIARAYEGDEGPVLRSLLQDTVIPEGFRSGNRWLLSWAFEMLNEKQMASDSSLEHIAGRILPKPMPSELIREKPGPLDVALVVAFNTIRSPSHVSRATNETRLAMLVIRRLLNAGCGQLAYRVATTWFFPPAPINSSNKPVPKTTFVSRSRHSSPSRSLKGPPASNTVIEEGIRKLSIDSPHAPRVLKQVVVPEFDLSNF
ncbi:hypothetical protein CROQUDRAFT_51836 [Cronartium quercuum f. sp. fusiforme G11]|uniref:RAVE complex protein Rav1 C-terminal domain-containing protein n=1 Tax=Cronartium quercuum f. sp. fusiforme G11 TaxID=708437 RepID=A0A9P6T788_9BASI|nr:hypothetical protein CROQUDRAFT_51836 [Cronartium quercuum f. sp. fusiforme G11]